MTNAKLKLALVAMIAAPSMAFGAGGGGGAAAGGGYVKMDPMVVNLEAGHYIQFLTQIKPKKQKDEKAEGAAKIPVFMPVIRHELMKSMIGQKIAAVQTPEFMESFSQSAAELINQVLDGDFVEAVFFENWIIQ